MVRIIAIASGKGGVGKTTTVANLSAILARKGYRTYAIDCNVTTSNLGLHVGMYLYPKTLHDWLEGRADIKEVIYTHPLGFNILPADISIKDTGLKRHEVIDMIYKLLRDADFIIIDTSAGLGKETKAVIEACDELLTITNPELPAVVDAAKLNEIARRGETNVIGAVVNRVEGKKHEMKENEIEDILNTSIITKIPEDKHVKHAIAKKIPVVVYNPKSKASKKFHELAEYIIKY